MARWYVYERYELDSFMADCPAGAYRQAEAMYGPAVVEVRCRPRPANCPEGPYRWSVDCERVLGIVEGRDMKAAKVEAELWWPGIVYRVQSVASVEAGNAERRFRPPDDDIPDAA